MLDGAAGGKRVPRNCQCYCPATIPVARVVERPVDLDGGTQPRDFPAIIGVSTRPIGLGQEKVPTGIEGVDLEFEILHTVSVRVEEDFEIVVVEDDRVMLRQGGPDIRLPQFGADVQRAVIPQQLRPGPEARPRKGAAPDIDEILGPRRAGPSRPAQRTVEPGWLARPMADIVARRLAGTSAREEKDSRESGKQDRYTSAILFALGFLSPK